MIKQVSYGGLNSGGLNPFKANLTINGNNPLSKIILRCASYTTRIEFVYSDSQTFGYCYSCSGFVKNYSLDMSNKELFSLGLNGGANLIIDTLEICVKDLTTLAITCMKGCDASRTINIKYYFQNYNIISFIGSFDGSFNSLAKFGVQYTVIN